MAQDEANMPKPEATPATPAVAPASQNSTPTAPVAPSAPGVPENKLSTNSNDAGKNVFTELFGNDAIQKQSKMMQGVDKQESQKKKSFFGKQPKVLNAKAGQRKVGKPKPGSLIMKVGFLLLLVVGVLGYTQNSNNFSVFGVNAAERLVLAEDQAHTLTAETRVWKHLTAVLMLDEYVGLADEYFYNIAQSESTYNSTNKRAEFATDAEELRPELTELVTEIQSKFDEKLTVDDVQDAEGVIDTWIDALGEKKGEVDEQSLLQEIQDLESTREMFNSTGFKNDVADIELDELTDEDLYFVFEEYNSLSASVTAIISQVRNSRLDWALYWDEIEDKVKSVDPLFNTEFNGNLDINSIQFNSNGGVLITGSNVTDDSKNFTLTANLIDLLNASDLFSNAEDRSYSKSNNEENYSGNFRVSMLIGTDEDDSEDDDSDE